MINSVKTLIEEKPGSTATELARMLHGLDGYSEQVGPALRALCYSGAVKRQGGGGSGDPYRYFPVTRAG